MPYHHACQTRSGRLAFSSHDEARALWDAVLLHVPDPVALCLMPDHIHLLHRQDVGRALGLALRGYARWRNTRHRVRGPLWKRQGRPDEVHGATKLRRSERYIHLNPCRAFLVTDPLAWPWSTHRDRVGLAVPAVRPPVPDPVGYHQYVSADPSVDRLGTALPLAQDLPDADAILAAISELTRTAGPLGRGAVRTLAVRSLRTLTPLTVRQIVQTLGVSRRTVLRRPASWTPAVRVVSQVAGDPRFAGLQPGDLRRFPTWARYRSRA